MPIPPTNTSGSGPNLNQVSLNIWITGTHSSQLCVQNKAVNAGNQAFWFLVRHNQAPPFVEFFTPFPPPQTLESTEH